MARQVNRKSAAVIGDPSSQTARSLIRNRTVKGSSVRSPFSSEGASRKRGDATKFPLGSSCMARGRTCSSTVYQVQAEAAHSVTGLMHSGH